MSKEEEEKNDDGPEERAPLDSYGKKNRYYTYVVDNVMRSSDELYQLCKCEEDSALCEEVISLLQKLAFDFETLGKMLKLKHSSPLIERKDSVASSCAEMPDISTQKNISNENTQAYQPSSSPGINVAAPDFIPSSYSSQVESSGLLDKNTLTFPNDDKKDKIESSQIDINSIQHSDQGEDSVSSYIDSPRNYENNFYNNQNYSHGLMSPNMYSFHPYQYSTHYIPPISPYHVPFSVYSHEMRNPNVMHIPALNTFPGQRPFHIHSQFRNPGNSTKTRTLINNDHKQHKTNRPKKQHAKKDVEKSDDCMKETKDNKDIHDNKTFYFSDIEETKNVQEHKIVDKFLENMSPTEEINATENKEKKPSLASLEGKNSPNMDKDSLLHSVERTGESVSSKLKNELKNINEKGLNHEDIESAEKNHVEKIGSFCQEISPLIEESKNDKSQMKKQFIFGLDEDECLIHFPELSSGQQKKVNRSKINFLGSSDKKSLELSSTDFSSNASTFKNVKERGISFSDIIKGKHELIEKHSEPAPASSSASLKNKTKFNNCGNHTPVKQQCVIRKNGGEEWLNETCSFILPSDQEDTEDSGGWEVVKTRSKWRDSVDLKPPRQNHNKVSKTTVVKENKNSEIPSSSCVSNVLSMNAKVKMDGKCYVERAMDAKTNIDKPINVKNCSEKSIVMKNNIDKLINMKSSSEKPFDIKNNIGKPVNLKNSSEKPVDMKNNIDKPINVKNYSEKPIDIKHSIYKLTIEKNNLDKLVDLKSNDENTNIAKNGLVKVAGVIDKPAVTNLEGSSGVKNNFKKSVIYVDRNEEHLSSEISLKKNFDQALPSYGFSLTQKSLEINSSPENKLVKGESFNDSYLNEGRSSSETLDGHIIIQSEETSPELGLYDDNVTIDPNEMYSAYMKYLSNVEAEEDSSGQSQSECVLHPEILSGLPKESENGKNPASLEQMTYFVNNDPVRALAFKKKLDSRIRHQEDMKKKNDEKQQLAHEKRLQFLQDKTAKIRGFVQKVEEVKAAQHELALQRKNKLDLKLKKAEEKRNMHLSIIKRKAHDEEEKLKEIAFINELEAQNRRHDSLALRQEHEERLQCLVEERQRRLEEKAAKEAAVEERRKALEAERQEKLELMKEKRRQKEEFIDRKQQEREQERLVIAREKAREREVRLMARHTAHQATLEELQKKIQQKQEESAKRHIESIELIRQKAIEIGIHRYTSDNAVPKYLSLYKPDGKSNKAPDKLCLKKRLKKIKSRMILRGSSYLQSTHKPSKEPTLKEVMLEKIMKKLQKHEPHRIYLWEPEDCDIVDRALDEILLSLQEEPSLKTTLKDMKAFLFFDSVLSIFNYSNHEKCSVPSLRCILKVITICDLSCFESVEVCLYFLLSNILATLLDSLRFSLQALERPCKSWDLIVELLLRFHALVIDGLNELPDELLIKIPDFPQRMKDLISYILCSGLVNKLIDLFRPSIIDDKFIYKSLVVPSILFFKRLLSPWFISDDLVDILKSTDLLCTVPLLYEGLMKQITNGGPLPEYCMPSISLFLKLADLDLKVFQDILGAENIALQWRAIASALMTYCVSQNNSPALLNSVIRLVGYFAIHNKENQTLLQSGKQPTVLQQLVKLPFQYFCDPEYMQELFPTLISCSYKNSTNRAIVENEIDYNGLEEFMHSESGQKNVIIQLLLEPNGQNDSSTIEDSPKCSIHVPD